MPLIRQWLPHSVSLWGFLARDNPIPSSRGKIIIVFKAFGTASSPCVSCVLNIKIPHNIHVVYYCQFLYFQSRGPSSDFLLLVADCQLLHKWLSAGFYLHPPVATSDVFIDTMLIKPRSTLPTLAVIDPDGEDIFHFRPLPHRVDIACFQVQRLPDINGDITIESLIPPSPSGVTYYDFQVLSSEIFPTK